MTEDDRQAERELAASLGPLVEQEAKRLLSERVLEGDPERLADGWETRRRRGPGDDWCIVRLGCRGVIESIEVDTAYFRGNYPDRCSIEIADAADTGDDAREVSWTTVLPETPLEPDRVHTFEVAPDARRPATHARFRIYPDGHMEMLQVQEEEGHKSLHRSSVNAIKGAAPFRDLPDDFPEDFLEVKFGFYYLLPGDAERYFRKTQQ